MDKDDKREIAELMDSVFSKEFKEKLLDKIKNQGAEYGTKKLHQRANPRRHKS